MTAAKMILHDWQRGRIPFFVPPPKQEEGTEEPSVNGVDIDDEVGGNEASAAIKAIADVLSTQQQTSVPVQKDLYSENELKGEATDQTPNHSAEEDIPTPDSDTSEQDSAAKIPSEPLPSAELDPTSES